MKKQNNRFDTQTVHAGTSDDRWQGATLPPIFQAAGHGYDTADQMSATFAGHQDGHVYMRLSNPTNQALEIKLAELEGAQEALVTASGMAAISNTCMALVRAGDEAIASNSLFYSTYILFSEIFKRYGITVHFVDADQPEDIRKVVNEKTRFIYAETIGNPKMDIPDLNRLAAVAHENGLPLVVDNTMAGPYLCRPMSCGADIVVHSTTKYLSGHGQTLGGVILDNDGFSWEGGRFADVACFRGASDRSPFMTKLKREYHFNFGAVQSPFHSYLTFVGIETLALRMERHCANALAAACFLNTNKHVKSVNYPGLTSHSYHEAARRMFNNVGFGGMMTFRLKDRAACYHFIDRLQMIRPVANLGDCKTMVIHPFSTQFVNQSDAMKKRFQISDDMIRMSVGIENPEDIMEDLDQALSGS